jgi:phosphoribosylformylglycinamidine synthase
VFGKDVDYIWHQEKDVRNYDCIILPGGFSYGDYLRTGAIAHFSPVMDAVTRHAEKGKFLIGICNGFQVLCESHLLPGALVRNTGLKFACKQVHLRTENNETPWTNRLKKEQVLRIPIAHGEGCFVAEQKTLDELNNSGRVLFRYCDKSGVITEQSNPNGSLENIAGIANETFNVVGMMPHPERASEKILGSADGWMIFDSIIKSILLQ